MKTTSTLFSLVIATFLTGCGTTVHYMKTNEPPGPRPVQTAESVHIFTTGGPARPYTEIGIIQARQDSMYSHDDMPAVLSEMREEAGRRGCDGLVITGRADRTESSVFGQTTVVGTSEGLMGTCIVYVDPLPEQDAPMTAAVD